MKIKTLDIIEKLHIILGFTIMGIGTILMICNFTSLSRVFYGYLVVVGGWFIGVIGCFIYSSDWMFNYQKKQDENENSNREQGRI